MTSYAYAQVIHWDGGCLFPEIESWGVRAVAIRRRLLRRTTQANANHGSSPWTLWCGARCSSTLRGHGLARRGLWERWPRYAGACVPGVWGRQPREAAGRPRQCSRLSQPSPCLSLVNFLSLRANARSGLELCHESIVFAEIRQGASSRLQDRASPRQGLRDLQEQPAFQGASTLSGNLTDRTIGAAQAASIVSRLVVVDVRARP